jgi:CheY-like chemotaxis protein
MARVLALVPDLMFGSRLQGSLSAAGVEIELLPREAMLRARLSAGPAPAVLIVDLADAALEGAELVRSLREQGTLADTRTVGFYAHVDAAARTQAERAGFDLVVPRSRMARAGAQLVGGLLERKP